MSRKNEELATSGPYAYTRNPLYFGSIVIAAGFALAALRWEIAVALVILFAAIYIPVIRGEEQFLSRTFCQLRGVLRARAQAAAQAARRQRGTLAAFRRELYRKHREYNALLGTLAVIAALARQADLDGALSGCES